MTAANALTVWIDGIGLLGPGLDNWRQGAEVLAGRAPYQAAPTPLPPPALLPPAERRRASRIVKLALAVGLEAVDNGGGVAGTLMTVFASSSGDGNNCDALCVALASDDRQVSPTRFTNSVHNTAAGYWGIATGATAASQVLCAHDGSFSAGLIEAIAQVRSEQTPVLLLAYDAEYAGALHLARQLPDAGGIALLLSPQQTPHSRAALSIELDDTPATALAEPALEALRLGIPALRGLPLLQAMADCQPGASGQSTHVSLDYLAPLQLQATVTPC